MLDGILLEKAGIPAVSIVTEPFEATGREMAASWGVPEYRFLQILHPIGNLSDEEIEGRVDAIFAQVIHLLKTGQGPE